MARLDHLILVAPDLDRTASRLEDEIGVSIPVGGRHPDWGTRNRILPLGEDRYLEIMGPDPAWEGTGPRLFGIDGLAESRLLTWSAASSDIDRERSLLAEHGVDPGEILDGERIRPDGSRLAWRLTDPRAPRLDRTVPFLIQWDGDQHPGRISSGCTLNGVVITHPEADRIRTLLDALGTEDWIRVERGSTPGFVAELSTPRGIRRVT